jgi:hypothetical protein
MTVAGSGAVQRWRRARADNITSDNEQGRSQSRDLPSLLPLSDHTGFLIQPEAHSTEDHDSTEVLSESEPMTNTRIMAEEEPQEALHVTRLSIERIVVLPATSQPPPLISDMAI